MADPQPPALPLSEPDPPLGGNAVVRFTPYTIPLSQDHRLDPLTPDAWKVDPFRSPRRYALWERYWGRRFIWPDNDIDLAEALARANERDAPGADAERIEWFEPVRFVPVRLVGTSESAWEIARVQIQPIGTGVLERIATYIKATPLDAEGQPVGPTFTTNILSDPLDTPLIHPTPGVGVLNVAWHLVAAGYSPQRGAGAVEPMLVGVRPEAIPLMAEPLFGLPLRWSDLRYAWGTTYTGTAERRVVVMGPVRLRFFAILQTANPARWRVIVGGTLAGFWQSAGPMAHARNSATYRWA